MEMKKKKKKVFRYLFIFFILGILFLNRGFRTLVQQFFYLKKLEKNLLGLKKENAELKKQLSSLKNDPTEIERIARTKLNLIKPGETIYRFSPEKR